MDGHDYHELIIVYARSTRCLHFSRTLRAFYVYHVSLKRYWLQLAVLRSFQPLCLPYGMGYALPVPSSLRDCCISYPLMSGMGP